MSDNWSRGWRKLVEWDNNEKVYKYKGHTIFPLSYKEQVKMPLHIQNSYYWDEISRIDRIEELPKVNGTETAEEGLDFFYKMLEEL